jgi:hypothetical protein
VGITPTSGWENTATIGTDPLLVAGEPATSRWSPRDTYTGAS